MELPTLDGYNITEARTELASETARLARLQRMQAGLEPNTLGGSFPDLRLDEALDNAWEQKEFFTTLVARLERVMQD